MKITFTIPILAQKYDFVNIFREFFKNPIFYGVFLCKFSFDCLLSFEKNFHFFGNLKIKQFRLSIFIVHTFDIIF